MSGRLDSEVIGSCVVFALCVLLLVVLGRSVGTEILFKHEESTDAAQHRHGCGRLEASLG